MLRLAKLRTALRLTHPHQTSKTSIYSVLVVTLGALCAALPGVAAGQTAQKTMSAIVETKEGPVQGFVSNGNLPQLSIIRLRSMLSDTSM